MSWIDRINVGTALGNCIVCSVSKENLVLRCKCGQKFFSRSDNFKRRRHLCCKHCIPVTKNNKSRPNVEKWKRLGIRISAAIRKVRGLNRGCANGKSNFITTKVGRQYGNLFVLAAKSGGGYWCRCSCGRIIQRKGFKANFACDVCLTAQTEKRMIGRKFGRLVVLRRIPSQSKTDNKPWFECKCDCGKLYNARGSSLRKGNLKSCGCLRKEIFGGHSFKYSPRHWRMRILRAAGKKCEICGSGANPRAHHLWSRDTAFGDGRSKDAPGVCLCEDCHKEFHDKYGYGNNTPMQYQEFRSGKIA